MGTRQLTLCPSSMNLLEPSPNLVLSEVPESGHHGFVKWGHDAKITKLASFSRVGLPARARPMVHRIGGRTKDSYLRVQLEIGSGLLMGIEIWGRQLTTRGGGGNWGPKRGSFWLLKMSQNLGVLPIVYLHAGLKIRSAIPYAINQGVQQRLPCTWLSKIYMPLSVVKVPIGSITAKMAKSSTPTLG